MKVKQFVLPLITAMIWGAAFSAQSICAANLGAFSVNGSRFFIAFLCMLPICLIRKKFGITAGGAGRKEVIRGCFLCGFALFLASNVQQMALSAGASAGKAGFVTALYIVLVPLGEMLLYRKNAGRLWYAVLLALVGIYFLCMTEEFTVDKSDLYLLLCAVLFTAQILLVDHFTAEIDGFVLACGEFLTVALCSLPVLCSGVEVITREAVMNCLAPLLYIAVLSGCVGYTLQVLAQKDGDPTLVSLLLSLESFFAVLFGAILLHERLTAREWIGCGLMTAAVLLAELPAKPSLKKNPG